MLSRLVKHQNVKRLASCCIMHSDCTTVFCLRWCSLKVFPTPCPQGLKSVRYRSLNREGGSPRVLLNPPPIDFRCSSTYLYSPVKEKTLLVMLTSNDSKLRQLEKKPKNGKGSEKVDCAGCLSQEKVDGLHNFNFTYRNGEIRATKGLEHEQLKAV